MLGSNLIFDVKNKDHLCSLSKHLFHKIYYTVYPFQCFFFFFFLFVKLDSINDWIIEVSILQAQSQYKPELSKDKKGKTNEGGTSKGTKSYCEEVPFLAKAFAQPFPIPVLHSDMRNLPQQHPALINKGSKISIGGSMIAYK